MLYTCRYIVFAEMIGVGTLITKYFGFSHTGVDDGIFADFDIPDAYQSESLMAPGTRATMPK